MSAAGNLASSHLVSCRQTTSGWRTASHSSRCGSLTLRELTFQLAMIMAGLFIGLQSAAGRAGARGAGPDAAAFDFLGDAHVVGRAGVALHHALEAVAGEFHA